MHESVVAGGLGRWLERKRIDVCVYDRVRAVTSSGSERKRVVRECVGVMENWWAGWCLLLPLASFLAFKFSLLCTQDWHYSGIPVLLISNIGDVASE